MCTLFFFFCFENQSFIQLDSPWTTSMPCLFSNHQLNFSSTSQDCLISSFNNLDLSNPFNIAATLSPTSSIWSLDNFNSNHEQEFKKNHFEPLPFFDTHNQTKQINYPQLSQKHNIIKQSKIILFN